MRLHEGDAVESISKLSYLEIDFMYFTHLQSWKLQAKAYRWNDFTFNSYGFACNFQN